MSKVAKVRAVVLRTQKPVSLDSSLDESLGWEDIQYPKRVDKVFRTKKSKPVYLGWEDHGGDVGYVKTTRTNKISIEALNVLNFNAYHSGCCFSWDNEICPDVDDKVLENRKPGEHIIPVVPSWYKLCELSKTNVFYTTDSEIYEPIARSTFLPHKTVTIVLSGQDPDEERIEPWYNDDEGSEGSINSRKYISVSKTADEVTLDSFVKGSPLTCEDILFATRALCIDTSRSYESFSVLSDNKGVLTLEVVIDNWST
jgi:hypothetical protein